AAGRPDEALAQYAKVLNTAPNRLNALIGGAEAAKAAGELMTAETYLAQARSQTRSGNQDAINLN
ncbi:MAG: hypothetical protein RIA10_14310, partial [Amphiplicatus sp.]